MIQAFVKWAAAMLTGSTPRSPKLVDDPETQDDFHAAMQRWIAMEKDQQQ